MLQGDKVLFGKTLFEEEYFLTDEFGSFTVPFKIDRVFSLKNGVMYRVTVSDMFTHRKSIYDALSVVVEHLYNDSPKYYRLQEHIQKNKEVKKDG